MLERMPKPVLLLSGLLLAVLVGCSPNPQPAECAGMFAYGRPLGPSDRTQFLCRKGYALLHDNLYKVPLYSAEHVRASNLEGSVSRTDDFRADPELPEGQRAELSDYRNSGYDRGHMAPAADFTTDLEQMSQSFLLSNMVPQNHTLNAGAWEGLEAATRACAKNTGEVYVLSGPIFAATPRTIGVNRVAVPSQVFKVILDLETGNSRAYIMPNSALSKTSGFTAWRVSIDTVEQLTGLDFFPAGNIDETNLGTLCKDAYGT